MDLPTPDRAPEEDAIAAADEAEAEAEAEAAEAAEEAEDLLIGETKAIGAEEDEAGVEASDDGVLSCRPDAVSATGVVVEAAEAEAEAEPALPVPVPVPAVAPCALSDRARAVGEELAEAAVEPAAEACRLLPVKANGMGMGSLPAELVGWRDNDSAANAPVPDGVSEPRPAGVMASPGVARAQ
jgi:hypothetical protein